MIKEELLNKDALNMAIELLPMHSDLLSALTKVMRENDITLNCEEMVQMLHLFDEIDNECGNAPDSDFVEALAYDTGTNPDEADSFWKYLAMGDFDAEWED